jgi:hypothetical protein
VLSSAFGVGIFLVFTLFATQLAVHLLAVTNVESETHDAARRIARAAVQRAGDGDGDRLARAELAALARRFGEIDPSASIELVPHDDAVIVRVRVRAPHGVVAGLSRTIGLGDIEYTARVRKEGR